MKGYVIFHGGDAFTPQNKQLHYDWLRLIRREHRPRVSVIPVAAQDKPVRAAQEAYPDVSVTAILDCDDAPGHALAA